MHKKKKNFWKKKIQEDNKIEKNRSGQLRLKCKPNKTMIVMMKKEDNEDEVWDSYLLHLSSSNSSSPNIKKQKKTESAHLTLLFISLGHINKQVMDSEPDRITER